VEIWSLAAAINVQQVMPQIETPVDKINIMALARRIERKFENPKKLPLSLFYSILRMFFLIMCRIQWAMSRMR